MFKNKDDLNHLLIYSIIISIIGISIFIINTSLIGIILSLFVGIVGGAICTIGFNLYLKIVNKYGLKVLWITPLLLIFGGFGISVINSEIGNILTTLLIVTGIPVALVLYVIYSIEIFFRRNTLIIKQEKCPICKKIRQSNENFCSNCGYNYNYQKVNK